MGDPHSFRLDTEQQEILSECIKAEGCDQSEAARKIINAGGAKLGYSDHADPSTRLRRVIQRSADGFALTGLIWVGLTLLAPVGFRALAIPLFAVSVSLYAAEKALASYEPYVSQRLAAMLAIGGDA